MVITKSIDDQRHKEARWGRDGMMFAESRLVPIDSILYRLGRFFLLFHTSFMRNNSVPMELIGSL
jgi:hypothetical protein